MPERVAYGPHPDQYAELTRPTGASRGTVVVIHGGFWRAAYDLSLGRPLARSLAEAGWTAWNLEYRRVGAGGGVPTTLDDVSAGIDALAGVADGPVVAVGHSAGGHLAVWAAGRPSPAVPLAGVVSQAGVVDLRAAYERRLGSGAVEAFLGHPYGAGDRWVDPMTQVPVAVPVWCVHAPGDDVVPITQSRAYVAAARAAGGTAELIEVAGDHFTVVDPASDAWARTLTLLPSG